MKLGRDGRPKIVTVKNLEMNWKCITRMSQLASVKCHGDIGVTVTVGAPPH